MPEIETEPPRVVPTPRGSHGTFDAESLLRSLMQNVPGAIYRCAMDGVWKMQQVSEEIESISGYPAVDFIDASKRTLVSVTHPDDRDPVQEQIDTAIAAHRPYALEFRVIHADGSIRWVLERGMKTIDRDGQEWLDGIIFDITARRASEELRLHRETEAARITELEASRARIIAAADAARRRIERDLHDGAQQQLLVAAMQLRLVERRLQRGEDPTTLVQSACEALELGLEQLRELARGIHPTVLSQKGLVPALRGLCARSGLTVDLQDALGRRMSSDVETALYYIVSEALTNVSRYSGTERAMVRVKQRGDFVELDVCDDGRGGADRANGSGLRGLEDRLSALDGTLELHSPVGKGTRLRVRVPLARDTPELAAQ